VGTDTYERQRAVRERIRQAKDRPGPGGGRGGRRGRRRQDVDGVDPQGRCALPCPAWPRSARSRPGFAVLLADAGATVGFRVSHVDGEVDVVVVPVIAVSPMGRTAGAQVPPAAPGTGPAPSDGVAASSRASSA
jgi:hypothetical protein